MLKISEWKILVLVSMYLPTANTFGTPLSGCCSEGGSCSKTQSKFHSSLSMAGIQAGHVFITGNISL